MSSSDIYERLVQSTFEHAIFMLDPKGRVKSWNPGAQHIYGFAAEEIVGQHFSRFYTDDDRSAGIPEVGLNAARQSGRFTVEGWRVRKDGERFWASVAMHPIYEDEQLIGFGKITRDMTEQRNVQLAALESERSFRILVHGVTDYAIFRLDPEGRVTSWNPGAQRIKGYAPSEIIGHHFSRFYTAEDLDARIPWKALETARRDGRFTAEGWRLRKDGTRFWASVVIDTIYDEGKVIGFAKVTRDLTERREAQLEMERSREQLFQSQKMEAVGQLTGGVAHDFNNLLTGISGSLELLRKRIAEGRIGDLERYLATAQSAASRAAALTHRLLAFSRRQTLDPRPTNSNKLIGDMAELVQRTVGPHIKVETVFGIGVWPILCDPNQLENAILNLCINARDAMPKGGQLIIETANTWLDERAAPERDMQPGQYVAICVTDAGMGMSPEVAMRAFDPFFTTKPSGQGTGLGLSMVYGFVRQSGGQVRIYSELNQGTTVRLYLPRHLGNDVEQQDVSPPVYALQAPAGKTVLVVDDEPSVRMLVTEVLEGLGYSAIEAGDGSAGMRVLQSDAVIDLLVTDVGLPGGLNGRQMADAARQFRPQLKVLFITGYAANAAISNGHLEPGMHVLTKPFAMDALASRVKAIIADI